MVNLELVYPKPQLDQILKPIRILFCTKLYTSDIQLYMSYIPYKYEEKKRRKMIPSIHPSMIKIFRAQKRAITNGIFESQFS